MSRASLLVILHALFLGRVLGQIVVTFEPVAWLPPLNYWQSGLLPYWLLLSAQILLLMFMSLVTYDGCRQRGYWHIESLSVSRRLRIIGFVYIAVMIARYVLTVTFVPELRWFGHAIPIAFHFVLAGYLLVLSIVITPINDRP